MVDLIARTPLQEQLPIELGNVTLTEAVPAFITSIMPRAGKKKACSDALKAAHGVALPAAGRSSGKEGARLVWTGRDQYCLMGDAPADASVSALAALTDQSDGWAVLRLEGENAGEIMARLCPIDLRDSQFKRGHTARTEVAHMMAVLTRLPNGYEIMVMRSFAQTLAARLKDAMTTVAGQAVLSQG